MILRRVNPASFPSFTAILASDVPIKPPSLREPHLEISLFQSPTLGVLMNENKVFRGSTPALFPSLCISILIFLVPWSFLIGGDGHNSVDAFVSRVTAYPPVNWGLLRTKRTTTTVVASTVSKELTTPDLVTNTPDFYTPSAVNYNYVPQYYSPVPYYYPSGFFPNQPLSSASVGHNQQLVKVKRKKKRRLLKLSDTSAEAAEQRNKTARSFTAGSVTSQQTSTPEPTTVPPQYPGYTDLTAEGSANQPQ